MLVLGDVMYKLKKHNMEAETIWSCTDNMATLKTIIKQYLEWQKGL